MKVIPYTADLIAKVREIGVTGVIWDDVAPIGGRSRDALQKIWTLYASIEEKATRREIRRRAIYAAQRATYENKHQATVAASRLAKMPAWVRFEDDPVAVADGDPFPKYRAAMFGSSFLNSTPPRLRNE